MQQNKILFRTQWKIRRIRIEADDAYGVCSCLTAEYHHETIKSAEGIFHDTFTCFKNSEICENAHDLHKLLNPAYHVFAY